MKTSIFAIIMALITLLGSCKKQTDQQPTVQQHEKAAYRVLAIGAGDTSISTSMIARTETVGIAFAEDSRLSAELIAYSSGVYTLKVVNKQSCQVIIRWGWEDILINNITPTSDVILANDSVIFTLTGSAHTGKIKLQAQGVDCGNSSTLIINIINEILPIELVGNTAKYDEKSGKTTISFTIEQPQTIDWIEIQKLNDHAAWQQVMLIGCDHLTKQYNLQL